MLKVFLSYARADGAEKAAQLRSELERAKIQVWHDAEDMRAGNDWREQLRVALREVDAVLVLLTPRAAVSDHVRTEWENAKVLNKYVIPVLGSETEVPQGLQNEHRRNLSQPRTYVSEFVSLLEDLNVVWHKLEKDLLALSERAEFSEFSPLVDRLLRMVSAQFCPPEVFRVFIRLIRRMQVDHKAGQSLRELIERIRNGSYVEDTSDMYQTFQENVGTINNVFFDFQASLGPDNTVPVAIVLAVMNRTQAEELLNFEPLLQVLNNANVEGWIDRYHDTPGEWQPFGNQIPETIEEVVTRVLRDIELPEQQLVPAFKDIRSLISAENRRVLKYLRNHACVVIVDSVSMFHPDLQIAFQQAGLDAHMGVSVVTISPTNHLEELVREMTYVFTFSIRDAEFSKRRVDDDEELGTCYEVLDEPGFRHWLLRRVQKIAPMMPTTGNSNRDFWWAKGCK